MSVLIRRIIWRTNLLADSLDCTVESAEETTPNTEVTTENGSASLDGSESTDATLAVGAVAETFDTVPDCTTNSL